MGGIIQTVRDLVSVWTRKGFCFFLYIDVDTYECMIQTVWKETHHFLCLVYHVFTADNLREHLALGCHKSKLNHQGINRKQ